MASGGRSDAGAAAGASPPPDTGSFAPAGRAVRSRLLALEPDARNRALLRLAYAGGLRVSELVALRSLALVDRAERYWRAADRRPARPRYTEEDDREG